MKYNIQRNNFFEKPKSSTIYTPAFLVEQIWDIVNESGIEIKSILDPSVGSGALVKGKESITFGIDIEDKSLPLRRFLCKKFEDTTENDFEGEDFDLVICNPPFNGHPSRKLYPEVFLRHITMAFGDIPIVLITPPTLLSNQRIKSSRWKWIRENVEISSILTLPIDIFEDVLVHSHVIFFNFPRKNIKPHYFLKK